MDRTGLVLLLLSGFVSLCRPWPEFISREFHVDSFGATWTEAQTYCRQHYTDLATIDDSASNDEVNKMVARGSTWTGFHQVPWKWSDSGQEAVVDSGWYHSSDTGSCTSISRTGNWSLEDCNTLHSFSCYSSAVDRHILHLQPMNFYDAQSYCRNIYSDLSTIKSQNDTDEISDLLQSDPTTSVAWIGLQRYAWTWSDSSNSYFWHFMEGRQTAGTDHCGSIESYSHPYRWGSIPCTEKRQFVCHRDVRQSVLRSVKIRVEGGSADLNDTELQQSILRQLQQKLKDQGITRDMKLWWKRQPDGEVFHREEEDRGYCEAGDACETD